MSFGNKLGRGIGTLGAFALEGAVRGASAAGQFGSDVIEGAQQGYDEKHAVLLVNRAQQKVAREAALLALRTAHNVAQNPAVMAVVAEPVVKRGRVAL